MREHTDHNNSDASSLRMELDICESVIDHSLPAFPIDEGVDPHPLSSSSAIHSSVFSCLFSVIHYEDSVYQHERGGGSGFVWVCHSKPRECIHDNRLETSFRFFPNARSMNRTASRWYGWERVFSYVDTRIQEVEAGRAVEHI